MGLIQVRVRVAGRVQGVGFRNATLQAVQRRGSIRGWVRNLANGHVEAVFQGDPVEVEKMVAWMEQGEPPARVNQVWKSEEPVDPSLKDFKVIQ